MRGLVLAGGTGSRLWPASSVVSKQLLPVYDKPMIYYPIATLMSAGIRELLLICRPEDHSLFERLLGDGSDYGIEIAYAIQSRPRGIAEAFILGADFIQQAETHALILGDNIFHGPDFSHLITPGPDFAGALVFACRVSNPSDYGVLSFDEQGRVIGIEEKPSTPDSPYAVPGLYIYDKDVTNIAQTLQPSGRNELEISDVNRAYLDAGRLSVRMLPRGTAWMDTGSFDALADAGAYVRAVEARQGTKLGCLEEIAWRKGWISDDQMAKLAEHQWPSGYGKYLRQVMSDNSARDGY